MLADDPLGAMQERYADPLPPQYYDAFQAIEQDPNNELLVANQNDEVVGVLHVTFTPYLTYQGAWRATTEGVRVARSVQAQGVGRSLVKEAVVRARSRGCHLVQLTTDKTREDAKVFYERLGFAATHEGMKLHLGATAQNPPL